MEKIDVEGLRRMLKSNGSKDGWTTRAFYEKTWEALPDLLSELERLRKIAERVKHTCFDCQNYDGLAPCPDCNAEDKWLPLAGEKEE